MPISSHELLSLPKTNVKNMASGNVTGLKFENRTRTQSRPRSPIWRSLLAKSDDREAGARFVNREYDYAELDNTMSCYQVIKTMIKFENPTKHRLSAEQF